MDEYLHLREASGLSPKPRAAAERGLAGTWFGVTLRDAQGRAIAMGRVVGDGGCFFQVVDIAVLPAHQRRGYGARVVEALMNELRTQAPRGAYVSLLADGEAPRLYAKFGFAFTAPHSVGMAQKL